jgi:hypothetical protein
MGCFDVYCDKCSLPFTMYTDVPLECDIEWVNHAVIYMKDGSKLQSDSYDSYGQFFMGEDLVYDTNDEKMSIYIYHVACEDVDVCEEYASIAEECQGQEFNLEKLIKIQGQYILRRPYIRRDPPVEPTMDMLQPLITCFENIMESKDESENENEDGEDIENESEDGKKMSPFRRFQFDINHQLDILREKTKELKSIQTLSWYMFAPR